MKGLLISDTSRIHKFSQKGGITRPTRCPYCQHVIYKEDYWAKCGHVEKIWEADGRWYVKFNQFKQVG